MPITDEFLAAMEAGGQNVQRLRDIRWTRDGADADSHVQRLLAEWRTWFMLSYAGGVPPVLQSSEEADDANVDTIVDPSRAFTYDAQRTGVTSSGARSVDTVLDQVVFGCPVASHDLWMKSHLHEGSRRRNGQCGIDVIVASSSWRHQHSDGSRSTKALFTAEQAAVELVSLARKHFPDSALAQGGDFSKPYDDTFSLVDSELASRGLVNSLASDRLEVSFGPYLPKLLAFLKKPKDLDDIYAAMCKGNIYQQTAKQKKT